MFPDSKTASCNKDPKELIATLAEKQQTLELKVSQISENQREKEQELKALEQWYKEETEREQEKVMSLVVRLEERDQATLREAAVSMDTQRLHEITKLLYLDYNIRLIGVDCGLSFLMEAPASKWSLVVEKQLQIQGALGQLLPQDLRQSASWSEVARCPSEVMDIELRQSTKHIKYLTLSPKRVFLYEPETAGEELFPKPRIGCVLSTRIGTLVIADTANRKVSLIDMTFKDTAAKSLMFTEKPWMLALLSDGFVALTTSQNIIELQLTTLRVYVHIVGNYDQTLIVSCKADSSGPWSVDVITRSGEVLRSVINGSNEPVPELLSPWGLCLADKDRLLISDFMGSAVLTVELSSGKVVNKLDHPEIQGPGCICKDTDGFVYVASVKSETVAVLFPDGHIKALLTGQGKKYRVPESVCFTQDGLLVVAWLNDMTAQSSVLMAYKC